MRTLAMQPEILRFLLLARAHLRDDEVGERSTPRDHADMQAIDRALPDADWFELAVVDTSPRSASQIWDERRNLQF
jgi:hypothetical protein